MALNSVFLCW